MIKEQLVTVLLNNRVPLGIVSKVRLVHKLVIERRIHSAVASSRARWSSSFLSFEELRQNQLLLILHAIHVDASSLNRSATKPLTRKTLLEVVHTRSVLRRVGSIVSCASW